MQDITIIEEVTDLKSYLFFIEELDGVDANETKSSMEELEKQIIIECIVEDYMRRSPFEKVNFVLRHRVANSFNNYVFNHLKKYITC